MERHSNYVYVIKQLDLALRPRFFELCAAAGLTGAQYTALSVLHRRSGITSSELARRSFVRAQTMAATVDPLIEAGYVRREHDPDHGRRILLHLTDTGARVVDALAPRIDELERLLVSDLDPREQEQFADYLRRARATLERAGHRVAASAD